MLPPLSVLHVSFFNATVLPMAHIYFVIIAIKTHLMLEYATHKGKSKITVVLKLDFDTGASP